MAWGEDGFCSQCQEHINGGCNCEGADAERQRRSAEAGEGDVSPRSLSAADSDSGDSGDSGLSPESTQDDQPKHRSGDSGDTGTPKRQTVWTAKTLLAADFPPPKWAVEN